MFLLRLDDIMCQHDIKELSFQLYIVAAQDKENIFQVEAYFGRILVRQDSTDIIYGVSIVFFKRNINSDYYKVLSFYQDSYELILDLIVFAIGMNNIEIRNDYNCFPEKIGVNDFEKLYKNAKYNRINFIKDDEPYFKYINMDRNIRNSIAHFDYEYDNELQLFTFHDSGKEGEVSRKITLYDFEVICFKNLKMIIYLNEIFYSIRKLSCLDDGLTLNIKSDFKNKQIKI